MDALETSLTRLIAAVLTAVVIGEIFLHAVLPTLQGVLGAIK
jgi:hypothetical protein